ncbi:F-box protein, partial [Trifolium medium]|nr:F-box protein [Trifolium medium]
NQISVALQLSGGRGMEQKHQICSFFAIKILSLTCSSSGREQNWSAFEHIHSKKRNRLEQQMFQDLVFIKYNQNLKECFSNDDVIDFVVMDDDIDTSNEWLLGDEGEAQPDLVFDGDDLSWLDVDIA